MKELKLNYKRTFYIGFAFFAILMLWQIYNTYCPVFLNNLLESSLAEQGKDSKYILFIIGVIMAMDNVLALIMLPIFGRLSDKTKNKYGKRMPFIIIGMLASIVVFPLIALSYILNSFVALIISMLLVLIIMNIYRSPAVALMPDVTPKPLRSKANGIINLVGYLGGIIAGALALFFATGKIKTPTEMTSADKWFTIIPFIVACVSLFIAIVILVLKINEPKLLLETEEEMKVGELLSETESKIEENKPLSKTDKKNIWILLISVFLWFMAFNAVETFNSLYFDEVIKVPGGNGIAVIVLTISSIITFVPAGFLASKIGRKKSVLAGIVILIIATISLIFIKDKKLIALIYLLYALAGIGWATINVNSYPMMVEMSHKDNIGKYTGYYYTASMLAQSITPILVGSIMTFTLQTTEPLFYYSSVLGVIVLVVFSFYKESKNKNAEIKKGLEAFDQD